MDKNYISLLDGLTKLYSNTTVSKKIRVAPNLWQDEASNAIKYFSDGSKFIGSIFKAYRDNNRFAKLALSDCKELNKPYSLYFLKIVSELAKKQIK